MTCIWTTCVHSETDKQKLYNHLLLSYSGVNWQNIEIWNPGISWNPDFFFLILALDISFFE